MRALLGFAPLLRPHLRRFGLALLLALVTLMAGTALLGVSGWFLTAAALTTAGISFNLFAPSAAVRGFSLIRILARYGEKLSGHDATLRLLSDIRRWLFAALFPRLPLAAGKSLRHGDLVSRLTADVDALDTAFLLAIGPLLAALTLGGMVAAVLFWLLPGAGWIYLCGLLAAALGVPALLVVAGRRASRALVEASATLRIHVLDAVAGHDDIALFGRRGHVAERFEAAGRELSRLRERLALWTALGAGAVQVLSGAALLAALLVGLTAHEAGEISGPLLAGLLFAVLGSFEATGAIVRSVGRLGAAIAAAERLEALAAAPAAIREPTRPIPLPPGGAVAFEDVRFAYGEGAPALESVSLSVAEGEHVAILGPSGAGKSTLLALLLRLHDPQAGRVRVAETDIRDVVLADLHGRVALLGQQSPVFLDTVRGNLAIARPDATDAELWAALRAARLEIFVCDLPAGLDTVVGEAGATFSVGQARRLCLARTLLSDARIVALDEPTSGLDRETETAFFVDLGTALAGRTVLLVTHARLPAGAGFRVVTLRDGRIGEAVS